MLKNVILPLILSLLTLFVALPSVYAEPQSSKHVCGINAHEFLERALEKCAIESSRISRGCMLQFRDIYNQCNYDGTFSRIRAEVEQEKLKETMSAQEVKKFLLVLAGLGDNARTDR